MTIGDRIAKYRRNQGLSQEELAEKLGISRQSVSKWERNESLPEADKIPLLAQVFSITTDELLTGEEPQAQQAPPPPPSRRQGAGAWVCWLFRRWGWVGGLILAGYGAAIMGVGFIGKAAFRSMLPPMEIFTDGVAFGQPAFLITNLAIGIGGAVVLGGLVAALVLWRKRNR